MSLKFFCNKTNVIEMWHTEDTLYHLSRIFKILRYCEIPHSQDIARKNPEVSVSTQAIVTCSPNPR